ncbi:MAG: NUDIX domain-containing protein [Gammaproteobacteria bacterium]
MLDAVVVAAPMQPPHAGHRAALERAAARGRTVVALLLGADAAPTLQTPWTTDERRALLHTAWPHAAGREVLAVRDVPYDRSRWSAAIARRVREHCGRDATIGVIGGDAVPWPARWQRLEHAVRFDDDERALRDAVLAERAPAADDLARRVSPAQAAALLGWRDGAGGQRLLEEAAFIRAFRARWASAPYPPVFVTVDALVTWRDDILLIERERAPGEGLWALPGGFIEQDETLEAGARRELAEETGLSVPLATLRTSRVFDAPGRSLRGRTITHAFHYDLSALPRRPAVRGADDARAAAWHPRETLAPQCLFEDHYAILQVLAGLP